MRKIAVTPAQKRAKEAAEKSRRVGQGIGGGRPPLAPGEQRVGLTVSVTQAQRDKVDRVSGNKPSEFVRAMIDSYPEGRKP